MSEYIEADWLKELYQPYESYNGKELAVPIGVILANIDDAPTIDIVRCRECKYFHEEGITSDKDYYCERCHDKDGFWREVKPDDFCSYGERKGADDEDD